ncbi:hypothetical protein ES332_D09G024200v1 [Gossypium tomentosum]|uniref:KH type-2 domain-containing protein n=1 Tax=Gossypium tomentosum TaxID=34277 RepID=A0A5D2JDB9_GOSTO|nr:hypothetical protein ES332_D09G024200v1 [Gossypium tomentosum]
MGQKINPLGFRLGTTQSHHSLWFAQPKKYSEGLQEDKKIRDCIKNYVQKNTRLSSGVEGIARIEIQKRLDLIQVIIYMGFPKLLIEDKPRKLEELQMNVQKELNCMNRKLNIAITRIGNPYGHPNILAEFIAGQLKNRMKRTFLFLLISRIIGRKGVQGAQPGLVLDWMQRVRIAVDVNIACFYHFLITIGKDVRKLWIFD